ELAMQVLAFGLILQARSFGDRQVDLEAEELGLLNRCFESRSQFFKCCGKFHVPVVGGIRPSPGCFKKDKRHRRTKSLLDPYRRAYKRCCDEPLLRHRQMLRKVNPHTEGGNYTLLYANPSKYFVKNDTLWLPGFQLYDLGAASMTERLVSLHSALLDFNYGKRAYNMVRSQELFRQGTSFVPGIDGESFAPVFRSFLSSNINLSYTFVDVGAADGSSSQSPLFEFMSEHRDRIRGVALEARQPFCARYRAAWPEVDLQCGRLTAQSLYDSPPSLKALKPACSEAYCVDVWKVDIDSIDCTVLEVLLRGTELELLPKALILEVNPDYPPPYKFSVTGIQGLTETDGDFWARAMLGLYGCSLSHQVALLREFGYWLIGYHHKDALYVHKHVAHALRASGPLDEFLAYSNALVMIGSGLPPPILRRWLYSHPHVGVGSIQQHLLRAQKRLKREVSFTLSI
ncbi:unnamed protein product, partial [Symbiodinium necroappetens]